MSAVPAPSYVRLPIEVVSAYEAGAIGKGELLTAMRLYRLLWGHQKPLEGSTDDFATALQLDVRSLQRHLPALGLSGSVLYRRPQRGYWSVWPPGDPAAAAGSDPPNDKTVVGPVVVSDSLSEDKVLVDQQQQQFLLDSPGEATKLSLAATKLSSDLVALGMDAAIAADLARACAPTRLRQLLQIARRDTSIANKPGWIRSAVLEHWQIRRNDPRGSYQADPADYLTSRYGDEVIQR